MSINLECPDSCTFLIKCANIATEDPTAYLRSKKQMMGGQGFHKPEQIALAVQVVDLFSGCEAETPGDFEHCGAISLASKVVAANVMGIKIN